MANQPQAPRPRAEHYADVYKSTFGDPTAIDGVAEFDDFRKEQLKAQFINAKKGLAVNPDEAIKKLAQSYQALKQPLGYYTSLENFPDLNVPRERELEVRVSLGVEEIDKKLGNLD